MSGTKRPLGMLAMLGLLAGLAACTNVKENIGLVQDPPDEFRVTARAPLSLPPEYALRPPRPGEVRPQEGTPQQQARQTVFRLNEEKPAHTNGAAGANRSPGEQAFLAAVGTGEVDPNIRRIVDEETDRQNAEADSFMDTLIFWREPEPHGEIVDANAESQRLKENASLGKRATEGQTPTIKRRERSLLEGIF